MRTFVNSREGLTPRGRSRWAGLALLVFAALLTVATAPARASDRVYWGNFDGFSIAYANLDGSGGAELPTPGAPKDGGHGFSIDESTQRLYWGNFGQSPDGVGEGDGTTLAYASLDGSGGAAVPIAPGSVHGPHGTAIYAGKIYWPNDFDNTIRFANLDGSGPGVLPTGAATVNGPRGVALDESTGRIYWANYDGNSISYAKLDGSGGGNIPTGAATVAMPEGPAIYGGRIYWGNFSAASLISYANLDGSGGGNLPTPGATVDYPHGVAIDAATQTIYWPNYRYLGGSISYAKLDGSGGADLPIAGAPVNGPAQPIIFNAPAASGKPQIHGGSAPGSTLSCTPIGWGGDLTAAHFYQAPASTTHQWLENGKPLAGESGSNLTAHEVGDYGCLDSATNVAGSTAKASDTIGVFRLGRVHRNLRKGTAKLVVKVPAAGVLKVKGGKVKKTRAAGEVKGGRVKLLIKPKGKARRKLSRSGKLKVKVWVSYQPAGGEKGTQRRVLRLKER